jgi:hypothetical protein
MYIYIYIYIYIYRLFYMVLLKRGLLSRTKTLFRVHLLTKLLMKLICTGLKLLSLTVRFFKNFTSHLRN